MRKMLLNLVMLMITVSCVDRVNFDPPLPAAFAVVIDGFISDQPGPYQVRVSKAFDIQSKSSIKQMVNVSKMTMSDNLGNSEELVRVEDGVYRTVSTQGMVGRAYSLRVELLDGRIYESIPDTLYPGGSVDRVYQEFITSKDATGATTYGFDVYFDSKAGDLENYQFLWKFTGTYQIDTNPEQHKETCGESQCPRPLPCSSYRLSPQDGSLEYIKPCECCTCWINIYNDSPLVSDDELVQAGRFNKVPAGYVPLTQWTFMYKVHAEVQQFSLSPQAFNFWRAIKAQKSATTSLFQPLTGKILGNFRQVGGVEGPVEGIFYASSIKTNSTFIQRSDIPNEGLIPKRDLPFENSCLTFGNSTNIKPDFWQ